MGKKTLFSHDPVSGVTTWMEDGEGDLWHFHTTQDCEPIIEDNKRKQSMGRDYYRLDDDMWRVASIPIGIQYQWLVKYGIKDVTAEEYWPKVRSLLNSNEWRYLKTAEIIV